MIDCEILLFIFILKNMEAGILAHQSDYSSGFGEPFIEIILNVT